ADNEAAEAQVSNQNVRSETQYEVGKSQFASTANSQCQFVLGTGFDEPVGWTPYPECGVGSNRSSAKQTRCAKQGSQRLVEACEVRCGSCGHGVRKKHRLLQPRHRLPAGGQE